MVEMLVVITIIAVLLSLTAAAVIKMIPAQQAINTKTELTRLQESLVKSYRSAADKFRKEPVPTSGPMAAAYGYVLNPMAGGNPDLARVIWVKLRLKQTFPNNFIEALNPSGYPSMPFMPALSSYQTKLNALGYFGPLQPGYNTNPAASAPALWESSVCLLWALQRGEDGTALQESDIGIGSLKDFGQIPFIATNPSSGQTRNLQPVKGLVDNWGTPLAFCRWPVYSLQLNPAPILNPPPPSYPPPPPAPPGVYYPQLGDNNDSDDPSGLLESPTWQGSAFFGQFQAIFHPLVPRSSFPQVQTYRISPLIVSAGPDKKLGLDKEPLGIGPGYALQPNEPVPYFFGKLLGAQGGFADDNIYPQLASPK